VITVRQIGNPSLREAEGYLDLLIPPSPQLRLSRELRAPLAERAIAVLDQVGNVSGWSAHALFLRGQALRIMERYSEAIDSLSKAAEIAPQDQHIRLALGWCYKRCQRIDLAIESLEAALDYVPDSAILHYNLACYWSLVRQVRKSVSYLARALELDPDYRDAVGSESDFDPIRFHPHFQSLLSVIV
jgi:tetratricopeptide (TPR) repeat protein